MSKSFYFLSSMCCPCLRNSFSLIMFCLWYLQQYVKCIPELRNNFLPFYIGATNACFDVCFVIVGWSSKGNLIAVARKDNISILSSNFEERSSMLIYFKPWDEDSDENCIVKGMLLFTVTFQYYFLFCSVLFHCS